MSFLKRFRRKLHLGQSSRAERLTSHVHPSDEYVNIGHEDAAQDGVSVTKQSDFDTDSSKDFATVGQGICKASWLSYEPLDESKSEIRLLRIEPDHERSQIRCTLRHVSCDGTWPRYTALSYVSKSDPNQIESRYILVLFSIFVCPCHKSLVYVKNSLCRPCTNS